MTWAQQAPKSLHQARSMRVGHPAWRDDTMAGKITPALYSRMSIPQPRPSRLRRGLFAIVFFNQRRQFVNEVLPQGIHQFFVIHASLAFKLVQKTCFLLV